MKDCCHSNHEPCHVCHEKEGVCEEEGHEDFASCLLEAADCAWMEVLKEKIKEQIIATQGDRMKELAKILAEENGQRWKCKMEAKKACLGFKEKLCRFFGHSK